MLTSHLPAAAVAKDVTAGVVPSVESTLVDLVLALNDTVSEIVPTVTGTVIPLAIDEVEALITVLGDVEDIVSSIESTLTSTVSAVTAGESFP